MHINREKVNQTASPAEHLEGRKEQAPAVQPAANDVKTAKKTSGKKHAKKTSRPAYALLTVCLILFLAAAGYKVYADQSLKPTLKEAELDLSGLSMENTDNLLAVRNPNRSNFGEKAGIIFYPASRVEPECYLPLMIRLSKMGYDCFLPKAFGNQSFLNVLGAASVTRKYEGIRHWYLAGHADAFPLALHYASGHPEEIEGLVCLGAQKGAAFSGVQLPLLFLYGSLDPGAKETAKEVTSGAASQEIDGGNRTGFLDAASLMSGDVPASLSPDAQIQQAAEETDRFLTGLMIRR